MTSWTSAAYSADLHRHAAVRLVAGNGLGRGRFAAAAHHRLAAAAALDGGGGCDSAAAQDVLAHRQRPAFAETAVVFRRAAFVGKSRDDDETAVVAREIGDRVEFAFFAKCIDESIRRIPNRTTRAALARLDRPEARAIPAK